MTGIPTLLVTPAADAAWHWSNASFTLGDHLSPRVICGLGSCGCLFHVCLPHVVFLPSLLHWLTGHVGKILYQMLVIQAFRADHLLAMASRFVAMVMGDSFQHFAEQELDMATIVNKEVGGRNRGW